MSNHGGTRRRTYQVAAALLLVLLLVPVHRLFGDEGRGGAALRRADSDEASLLVMVRGVGICSGAPIAGTLMVVTAAHCLLDPRTGEVSTRHDLRVERDTVRYDIAGVVLDPSSTLSEVRPEKDAAIIMLESPVEGPGVVLPDIPTPYAARRDPELRSTVAAVLVGYQPVDSTGRLYRGTEYGQPPDEAGPLVGHVALACHATAEPRPGYDVYPCGMVKGGSGGPVVSPEGRVLLGIVSSVNRSLTRNGVTPVAEVLRLLVEADRLFVSVRDASAPEEPGSSLPPGSGVRR